jgi:hypothetical protein
VSRITIPRKVLAGGIAGAALLVALGVAAVAQVNDDAGPSAPTATAARASSTETALTPAPGPQVAAETPAQTVPPATVAPPATTPAPAAKATAPSTTATTRKAPATTVAPAPTVPAAPATTPTTAKVRSGARVAYTTASVQAAIAAITGRIPLFKPNDSQLRTFADAVCGQFDQGQTWAQVQATIRQAVTHIQGQSLSDADAAFMVQTVTSLRCPGYLP